MLKKLHSIVEKRLQLFSKIQSKQTIVITIGI